MPLTLISNGPDSPQDVVAAGAELVDEGTEESGTTVSVIVDVGVVFEVVKAEVTGAVVVTGCDGTGVGAIGAGVGMSRVSVSHKT